MSSNFSTLLREYADPNDWQTWSDHKGVNRISYHGDATVWLIFSEAADRIDELETKNKWLKVKNGLYYTKAQIWAKDADKLQVRAETAEIYAEKLQMELWNMVNRARDGYFHSGGTLDTNPNIASALKVLWEPLKK